MNKKANFYLNFFGLITFSIFIICLWLYLNIETLPLKISQIAKMTLPLIGVIACFVYVSIELLLFLLLKKKLKAYLILYSMVELITSIFINSKISFMGFIAFIIFYIVKNILRLIFLKKIYIPKEFDYYRNLIILGSKRKSKKQKETHKNKESRVSKTEKALMVH